MIAAAVQEHLERLEREGFASPAGVVPCFVDERDMGDSRPPARGDESIPPRDRDVGCEELPAWVGEVLEDLEARGFLRGAP